MGCAQASTIAVDTRVITKAQLSTAALKPTAPKLPALIARREVWSEAQMSREKVVIDLLHRIEEDLDECSPEWDVWETQRPLIEQRLFHLPEDQAVDLVEKFRRALVTDQKLTKVKQVVPDGMESPTRQRKGQDMLVEAA